VYPGRFIIVVDGGDSGSVVGKILMVRCKNRLTVVMLSKLIPFLCYGVLQVNITTLLAYCLYVYQIVN